MILIEILSCVFLFDSQRRIIQVVGKNSYVRINFKPMLIHLTAYVLYLSSLTYYFIDTFIVVAEKNPHSFLVSESIKETLNSLSQIALCYVFYCIHKTSLKEDETENMDDSLDFEESTPRSPAKNLTSTPDAQPYVATLVSSVKMPKDKI